MNHAVTALDLVRLGVISFGLAVVGVGLSDIVAGMFPDSTMGQTKGCGVTLLGIVVIVAACLLGGCASTAPVQTKFVDVDRPVAVQPIRPSDIPPTPPPLGPRPPTASQAADAAFAAHCRDVAFIIKAIPLLTVSAGLPAAQAPDYPECRQH